MPEFCSPFSVKKNDKPLTKEELIRAIRFSIAAEYESTQLYEQLAESIDNKEAKAVLLEVAGDELVHAGNFQKILYILAPEEESSYAKGHEEVKKLLNKKDND